MSLDLPETLQTHIAQVTQDQIVRTQVGHDGQGPALISRLAIAQMHLQQAMVQHLIDHVEFSRRGAGTATRALKVLGELFM
jgi:hypothetical protein